MRETLRLNPSAPGRGCAPWNDVVLGGKYALKAGTIITVNVYDVHRDPLVWGDDVSFTVVFAPKITIINIPRLRSSDLNECSMGSLRHFL
jgi:hypothetical protein